jgi:signal transduction histidine kinase
MHNPDNISVIILDSIMADSLIPPMGMNMDTGTMMHLHVSRDPHSEMIQNPGGINKVEHYDTISSINDNSIHSTITINAEHDSTNRLLFRGVKLLINTVGSTDLNQQNIYSLFSSNPDTVALKKIFSGFVESNYSSFSLSWQTFDHEGPELPGTPDKMALRSILFEEPYGVVIHNYKKYLLRSISSQIVFALILLLITAGAFRMAYNNLRSQRKLLDIKNDFISNVTHELKTPVSTVKVALEALLDFSLLSDPERTKEYLKMAHNETERLDLLVNQVLNNSALEEGHGIKVMDNIDLVSLVGEIKSSMQHRFDKEKAIVHLDTSKDNIYVTADKTLIHGVILNLLDNCIKYSREELKINIRIYEYKAETHLSVSDNGIGIPEEYADKIFDKFFRVPKGDSHNVKGYGLGLNYAAIVMKQHKGKIYFESNQDGGSIFTLVFPNDHTTDKE